MKIRILSDLHIEFAKFEPPDVDCDVVVLAGDIGVGLEALQWAARVFHKTPVVYVPGNHEFYHADLDLIKQFKQEAPSGLHVLDGDSVTIDGVRFLGAVLWTDFRLFGEVEQFFSMQYAAENMADFAIIGNAGQRFTPQQSIELHQKSKAWLAAELSQSFAGKTVVVTHHAPANLSVAPRFKMDVLSPAFASPLESFIDEHQPALWVHGHTHDAFDYEIFDTRVVCNPRGYPQEAGHYGFDPALVVELN